VATLAIPAIHGGGQHILLAVALNLAAHSPTERATDIARRLMLGAELRQEAGAC